MSVMQVAVALTFALTVTLPVTVTTTFAVSVTAPVAIIHGAAATKGLTIMVTLAVTVTVTVPTSTSATTSTTVAAGSSGGGSGVFGSATLALLELDAEHCALELGVIEGGLGGSGSIRALKLDESVGRAVALGDKTHILHGAMLAKVLDDVLLLGRGRHVAHVQRTARGGLRLVRLGELGIQVLAGGKGHSVEAANRIACVIQRLEHGESVG